MYTTTYSAQILFKNGSIIELTLQVPDGESPVDEWKRFPCDGTFKYTQTYMIRINEVQAIVFNKVDEDEDNERVQ